MICPRCDTDVREALSRADGDEATPACPNCGHVGPMFLTPREEMEAGLRPELRSVDG